MSLGNAHEEIVNRSHGGLIPLHRLENFSDAVFAFAVTLLVVSLEVPRSAADLFAVMRGFIAFGICFLFLVLIWVEHSRFFKRFPMADAVTVALNMLLLFVLLLYVYPLKFLFAALASSMIWGESVISINTLEEFRSLMVIYGLGFLALNLILVCMKLHALRLGGQGIPAPLATTDHLALNGGILRNIGQGLIALASILIAATTQDDGRYCGLVYALLGPLAWIQGAYTRRQGRK